MAPRFKRILLKLSGEELMGDEGFGIDLAERCMQEVNAVLPILELNDGCWCVQVASGH